jgi:MFS family permease
MRRNSSIERFKVANLSRLRGSSTASAALILLLCFLYALLYSMILLAAPLYALNLGADEAVLGTLVAIFGVGGLVLSLPGAMLCDRFGLRAVILLSFCSFAAANLLDIFARSPAWLLLGHFMAGLGELLFAIAGFAYLAEVVPQGRQNLSHSVAFSIVGVGWVAGSALAGYVAEWVGFGSVFILGLLMSAAALLLSLCLSPITRQTQQASGRPHGVSTSYKTGYYLLRANKTVRLVALITILATLGWHTFAASFYLDYLHQLFMSLGTIGILRALGSAARVAAPLVYFLLSNRIGTVSTIFLGVLVGALGLAMTPVLTSVPTLAIVGSLALTANYFYLPGVYTLLHMGASSQERPTAIAIQNASWALGAVVGGPLWAVVIRVSGLRPTFFIAGLVIMLGTTTLYCQSRRL